LLKLQNYENSAIATSFNVFNENLLEFWNAMLFWDMEIFVPFLASVPLEIKSTWLRAKQSYFANHLFQHLRMDHPVCKVICCRATGNTCKKEGISTIDLKCKAIFNCYQYLRKASKMFYNSMWMCSYFLEKSNSLLQISTRIYTTANYKL